MAIKLMTQWRYRGPGAAIRALLRGNEFFLTPVALVIGGLAGAVVTLMSEVAQIAHVLIFGISIDVRLSAHASVNPGVAVLSPMIGGLILGGMEWLRRRWNIAAPVDPIEANALRGGHLSLRDSVVVSSQTVISNGCGASVGLEAGYTQIGAGLASVIGGYFNLRRSDLRLMVGCGAAAAIAAAFGAPLTGAFYACELIVGVYSVGSAAPILAASLCGAMVANWLGGAPYLLDVPRDVGVTAEQSFVLIGFAVIISVCGILIMRGAALVERAFNRTFLPIWARPAVGGICVGAMAIVTPQVLAAGHGAMVLDFELKMSATLIVTIIGLKLCACIVSLASGFRGGLFFASLFVGSLIGKLLVELLSVSSFAISVDPVSAMLTCMACLGVAIVGGPLTMSFLVLEMTRSLDISAVVLAACILTSVCVRAGFGHSFSTWRLHLRGETIRSANDVGWLRSLTVGRMMRTDTGLVDRQTTIAACRSEFPLGSQQAVVVVDTNGAYCGLVMLPALYASELDLMAEATPVGQISDHRGVTLLPGMNVKSAIAVFDQAEAEVLAVVDSNDGNIVVGFLTEAYARRRYVEELDQATRGLLAPT